MWWPKNLNRFFWGRGLETQQWQSALPESNQEVQQKPSNRDATVVSGTVLSLPSMSSWQNNILTLCCWTTLWTYVPAVPLLSSSTCDSCSGLTREKKKKEWARNFLMKQESTGSWVVCKVERNQNKNMYWVFSCAFCCVYFLGGKGEEVGCLYSIRTKIHVSFFMIFTTDDFKAIHSIWTNYISMQLLVGKKKKKKEANLPFSLMLNTWHPYKQNVQVFWHGLFHTITWWIYIFFSHAKLVCLANFIL